MAQTQVMDPPQVGPIPFAPPNEAEMPDDEQQSEEQPQQPQRNRGGQPSKGISSAELLQGFFEFVKSLSPEQWENTSCYVYRWEPVIDHTKGGVENKYVCLFNGPFTIETLKQDQGSGVYELKLNQYDSRKRQDKTVRRIVVNILDRNYPPNIAPGEWMDHPRNSRWAWAKKNGQPQQPQNPGGIDPLQLMHFIRDTIRSERPDAGASTQNALMTAVVTQLPKLLEQQKPSGPDPVLMKMLDNAREDLKLVREQAHTGPDPVLMKMLDNAREDAKIARDEAQKARDAVQATQTKMMELLAQKNAPADIGTQLESLGKTIAGVAEIAGSLGGNAGPREWWQELIATMGPALSPALNSLGNAAAMRMAQQPRPQPRTVAAPNPTATTPAAQPAAATAAPTETQPTAEVPPQMDSATMGMVLQLATDASKALDMLMDGAQFADTLVRKWGEPVYDQIITLPKEQLMTLMRGVPDAWALLAPFEAKLPEFIDGFYSYNEPGDEDENDEPPPPPEPIRDERRSSKPKKGAKKK